MFHDPHLFFDQAPAAPAPPVSTIRLPLSPPDAQWPGQMYRDQELRLSGPGHAQDAGAGKTLQNGMTFH